MEICPECGKRHVVMWPDLDPFRRGNQFYCSHGCWKISLLRDMKTIKDIARKRRKGRLNLNAKITNDMRMKAAEMAINGESPLAYLRECGSKNPSASWQYIRSVLEKKNPEIYAKLPDRLPKTAGEVETPEGEFARVKVDGPIRIETLEPEKVKVVTPEAPRKITTPVNYDGYEVCCIQSKTLGRFYWDCDHNRLDWTTAEGEEVSFSPEGWKRFIDELPKIAGILGVQL